MKGDVIVSTYPVIEQVGVPVNPEIGVRVHTTGMTMVDGNVTLITGTYEEFTMRSLDGVIEIV